MGDISTSKISLMIFGTCLIIALIVAVPLYFGGHMPRVAWNNDLEHTWCKVVNYPIYESQCSYQCNCHRSCYPYTTTDSNGNFRVRTRCQTRCSTCYRSCWKSYYTTNYTVQEPIRQDYQFDTYYTTANSEDEALYKVKQRYPRNYQYSCYYHRQEPNKVVKSKYHENAFLYSSIAFFAIGGVALVGLLVMGCYQVLMRY